MIIKLLIIIIKKNINNFIHDNFFIMNNNFVLKMIKFFKRGQIKKVDKFLKKLFKFFLIK